MKIYISGPISGQDELEVSRAFALAKKLVTEAGHTPVSPLDNGLPRTASYQQHLLEDFRLLLDADAILLLYGWRGSKGCRMENSIATNMGKIVFSSFAALRHVRQDAAAPTPDSFDNSL